MSKQCKRVFSPTILNNRKFSESSLHSSASFREHFAYVSLQRTQKYSAISTCTAHFNHRPFKLVRLSHCVCLRTKKHTQKYSKPHSLDTNCLTRAQKPSLPSRLARCQKAPSTPPSVYVYIFALSETTKALLQRVTEPCKHPTPH